MQHQLFTEGGKIKKYILIVGIVSVLSIFIQHKYDLTYAIVYLENKYFHTEEYRVETTVSKAGYDLLFPLYRLDVKGTVKFSLNPEYRVTLSLPQEYITVTSPDIKRSDSQAHGYTDYTSAISSRKYRDINGTFSLFLSPETPDIPKKPITLLVKQGNRTVHQDNSFLIKTDQNVIFMQKNRKKPHSAPL